MQVLLDCVPLTIIEHFIDCDADPVIPSREWFLEEHQKGGQFKWNTATIQLWLAKGQQNGTALDGYTLRKELKGKSVLNANVLDYLLANPHLIPDEWKGKYVFFWGTVYRHLEGGLFIRCLCWNGDRWGWSYYWLGRSWRNLDPTILRAS